MKLITRIEWSIFGNTATVIFFVLLVQIATANNADQFSSRKSQNSQEFKYRYKRGSLIPPTQSTNSSTLAMITNQISKLQEEVARLNSSSSLSVEVKLRITSLETIINELQKNQDILQQELTEKDNVNNKTITSITQKLNTVLFHGIVQNIQSGQFSLAESQLKLVDNANYEEIVELVYNHNADNIDLLRSYGGFITDTGRKFLIYDALFNQMKANGHRDVLKLIRLGQAVKKEILDRAANAAAAQSLFNNLVDAIQTAAIETLTNSFLNDNSWSNINSLSIALMSDFPQSLIANIYKETLNKVLNTLDVQRIINRANKINHLESEMIILEAVFDRLEAKGALNTNPVISLAYGMISLTNRAGYQSVSADRRASFEKKKNKIEPLWILVNGL